VGVPGETWYYDWAYQLQELITPVTVDGDPVPDMDSG